MHGGAAGSGAPIGNTALVLQFLITPDQLGYLSPASDGFGGIMTVSECIRMARATLADIEQRAKFSTKDCKQLSNRELEREAIWQTLLQQAQ